MLVRLTRIVKWEEVGCRACREYALVLCAEHIKAYGHHGEKALALSEREPVNRYLGASKLHHHLGLQFLEVIEIFRL